MIELLATAGSIALVAPVLIDVFVDEQRPSRLMNALEDRLLGWFGRVEMMAADLDPAEKKEILDAWLQENAGTTEITDEEREFFAQQLKLAAEEIR